MSDIVDKAEAWDAISEKNAEIVRLTARVAELEEGLEPFSDEASAFGEGWADERRVVTVNWKTSITIGSFRRARALLSKGGE